MLHVDFFEISMTETMRVSIPIELTGEPVGVEQDGGILEHVTRELEVECLPGDLVEQFEIDVSALTIGDAVQVSDIQVSDKFDVITEPDVTVASVTAPRPEEEEEPEEVEEGEPEVIGEKKEEGEEETEGEEKEEEEGS